MYVVTGIPTDPIGFVCPGTKTDISQPKLVLNWTQCKSNLYTHFIQFTIRSRNSFSIHIIQLLFYQRQKKDNLPMIVQR